MAYEKEAVAALVPEIRAAGYRPFVAKNGKYGFYTDAAGTRVVSFQIDFGTPKFSGNHVTDAPRNCGTGWQLEPGAFADMFQQSAPSWARQHANGWRFMTLAEYLAMYQRSSQFQEVTGP